VARPDTEAGRVARGPLALAGLRGARSALALRAAVTCSGMIAARGGVHPGFRDRPAAVGVPCQNPHSAADLQVRRTGRHGMIVGCGCADAVPGLGAGVGLAGVACPNRRCKEHRDRDAAARGGGASPPGRQAAIVVAGSRGAPRELRAHRRSHRRPCWPGTEDWSAGSGGIPTGRFRAPAPGEPGPPGTAADRRPNPRSGRAVAARQPSRVWPVPGGTGQTGDRARIRSFSSIVSGAGAMSSSWRSCREQVSNWRTARCACPSRA